MHLEDQNNWIDLKGRKIEPYDSDTQSDSTFIHIFNFYSKLVKI